MTDPEQSHDPKTSAEDLEEESRDQGERVKEAEQAPFTTRQKHMHEKEDPADERMGKKTSQDYA